MLHAENISKAFDGELALDRMSLEVQPGEIHGLLGHNGSGKSTFIKILSGVYHPEPGGRLSVDGTEVSLPVARNFGRLHGIGFVYQDLALIDSLSVAENLRIRSVSDGRLRWVGWGREQRICADVLDRWGVSASPTALVSDLTPVQKALVAIARAMHELEVGSEDSRVPARLLVLDEPTAFLPRQEEQRVLRVVYSLKESGVATLFVSHKSEEVLELTDRVTVLRDGRTVGTAQTINLDLDRLRNLILGTTNGPTRGGASPASEAVEHTEARSPAQSVRPSVVSSTRSRPDSVIVEGLRAAHVRALDFSIAPGEVLGFTGLEGSGAGDIPGLLFGSRPALAGTLTIRGQTVELKRITPGAAMTFGMAMVPGDRLAEGGDGDLTLAENAAPILGKAHTRFGVLQWRSLKRAMERLLIEFRVRPAQPERLFSTLSGGNQQKLVIGKWLGARPDLLLLEEPTHGVDVGAVAEILKIVREAQASGLRVVVASTDEGDLAQLADRVIVLRGGVKVTELVGADICKDNLRRAVG